MKPFGKLLKSYSEKILKGTRSNSNIHELWEEATKKVIGSEVGSPIKLTKDKLFISCSSSEELSHVKMFQTNLINEIQQKNPKIKQVIITISKN